MYIKPGFSLNLLNHRRLQSYSRLTDVKLFGLSRAENHFLLELRKAEVEL